MKKLVASLAATTFLLLSAASAWAQQATDYTISEYTVGSRYEAPPGGATVTSISGDDSTGLVTIPFSFNYFGTNYTSCYVCTNGWLSFTTNVTTYSNSTFPTTTAGISAAIFPYWDDFYVGSTYNSGSIQTWTTGSAPNRHFVVSWESATAFTGGYGPYTVQVQLYEGTGTIVCSYFTPSGGSWPMSGYTLGIQAEDSRYQYPTGLQNDATANNDRPPSDYMFSKPRVTFTGRVLYDRYIVNGSGIGNASQQNVPLGRTRVEARDSTGSTIGSATTDAAGNFSVEATGAAPTTSGSIVVCSQNDACAVRSSAGGPLYAATAATNVSFSQDAALGTLAITESNDAGGAGRAPIHIAAAIQATYDWARSLSSDSIPSIEVLYSTSSPLGTSYTKRAGNTPATMRVSGASTNPDPWDAAVIRKTYARHILGAIAADPTTTTYDTNFDAGTDAQNAFAEAFGYYVNAVITGGEYYYDGVSSSATNAILLESPNGLHSTKSPNAAAWVAEALYDMTDGANESFDPLDGTATPTQVFLLVNAMTSPATASALYDAWIAQGFDAPSITRLFIAHGLLPDDSDEPNDDAAQPKAVPQFGVVLTGRVLNRYNEDWYAFTMPDLTKALTVTVVYDRGAAATAVMTLQLRSAAGAVLGTGSPLDTGPIQLVTGELPAGDYRIRVALSQGGPIASYSLQAFAQLTFKSDKFPPWTIGRPYSVSLNVTGGIPPYGLTIPSQYAGPEGLVFDGEKAKVEGVPSGPSGGLSQGGSKTYVFLLAAIDAASPQNSVSKLVSFTLNDAVRPRFGEFTAFAADKSVNRPCPIVGGTPPFDAVVTQGALPLGVAAQSGSPLRFVGAAAAAGSTDFHMSVADVSGYTANVIGRAVTCARLGALDVAAGASAGGYYFDAVAGTSVTLTISTAKGKPVRTLRGIVLDTDGDTALPAKVKFAKGKGSLSGFVAPRTGRYYFVIPADDSGDATTLAAKSKFAAPKSGSGSGPAGFGDVQTFSVTVPALAGAALAFTAKPDKSGLALAAPHLFNPAGVEVPLSAVEAKVVKGAVTIKKTLPTGGDWTVVLAAAAGPSGTFKYSFKIKQPAKVLYSVD